MAEMDITVWYKSVNIKGDAVKIFKKSWKIINLLTGTVAYLVLRYSSGCYFSFFFFLAWKVNSKDIGVHAKYSICNLNEKAKNLVKLCI